MALERDAIVRRDFPVGRRGYDQAAVDAHLERVAAGVEELRRAAQAPAAPAGVAGAASEQVRAIVAAAEESAAGIERAAREEAQATRARADDEARTEVSRVREVVGGLLERLRAIDGELAALEAGVGELRGTVPAAPEPAAEPATRPGAQEPAGEPAAPAAPEPADGDLEGARLVALNLALEGRARDEVRSHLAESFDLADADAEALLDEVYASVDA
jgi:DivIVA domain-containing protein